MWVKNNYDVQKLNTDFVIREAYVHLKNLRVYFTETRNITIERLSAWDPVVKTLSETLSRSTQLRCAAGTLPTQCSYFLFFLSTAGYVYADGFD